MRFRPLDEGRDMTPCYKMLEGKEAVGAAVESRLRFYYGDWWEDETLGFKIPKVLIEGARRGTEDLLAGYISSYIAETPGVIRVSEPDVITRDRDLRFECSVVTEYGEVKEGVESNGIYSALL